MLDQLTIIAPGLLGGSLAMAARARGLARHIVIWARRPETREALRHQDWCDEAAEDLPSAVKGASLVVLAPPVDKIPPLLEILSPHLSPGAIVTDVGSVKGTLSQLGHSLVPAGTHFVGSHPMAGSDKTGWENGSASLFEKRVCFVTPLPQTSPQAASTVSAFWQAVGMTPVTVSPSEHDRIVAHISHLPQLIASSLCSYLAEKDPRWRDFSGGGLRDTTRIAGSDPAMWRAILDQNREQVLAALTGYEAELKVFREALATGDFDALMRRFENGRAYRSEFPR